MRKLTGPRLHFVDVEREEPRFDDYLDDPDSRLGDIAIAIALVVGLGIMAGLAMGWLL